MDVYLLSSLGPCEAHVLLEYIVIHQRVARRCQDVFDQWQMTTYVANCRVYALPHRPRILSGCSAKKSSARFYVRIFRNGIRIYLV